MKKLNLFLTLLLTITLFSCGSDDDGTLENIEITEANLIGTWDLTSGTENGESYEPFSCVYRMTLATDANGENVATFVEGYIENGDCQESTSVDYWWAVSGNNLNTGIEDIDTYDESEEIIELSSTTLRLRYTEEEEGITYTYVDTYTKL